MIFTTALVYCLCALIGVFQQASLDTLMFTLAHLRTPSISAIRTFLQVASSATRLTLDSVPFTAVDSLFSQTSATVLSDGFTNSKDGQPFASNFTGTHWASSKAFLAPPIEAQSPFSDPDNVAQDLVPYIFISFLCCFVASVHAIVPDALVQLVTLFDAQFQDGRSSAQDMINTLINKQPIYLIQDDRHEYRHDRVFYNPLAFVPSVPTVRAIALFGTPAIAFVQSAFPVDIAADTLCRSGIPQRTLTSEEAQASYGGFDGLCLVLSPLEAQADWTQDDNGGWYTISDHLHYSTLHIAVVESLAHPSPGTDPPLAAPVQNTGDDPGLDANDEAPDDEEEEEEEEYEEVYSEDDDDDDDGGGSGGHNNTANNTDDDDDNEVDDNQHPPDGADDANENQDELIDPGPAVGVAHEDDLAWDVVHTLVENMVLAYGDEILDLLDRDIPLARATPEDTIDYLSQIEIYYYPPILHLPTSLSLEPWLE
ncbi:hypothetical protein C2E23DRAFT_47450 [Lenzites betulinus]|nr:hypothetical protein C2E23DRAFT_47450 [Lenzites betulinus]